MHLIKKSNNGFSLVELVIVMAIMIALVAVLAPQFVKYVQKAKNSTVLNAADNTLSMVKAEYSLGNLTFASDETEEGKIRIWGHNGHIEIILEDLVYLNKTGDEANKAFEEVCGVDRSKKTSSTVGYEISVKRVNNQDSFSSIMQIAIEVDMSKMDDENGN